jgi:hypothetical protein
MQCVLIRSVTYADVMTACVYYHYLEDSQYSFAYVTQDRNEITTPGQDAIIGWSRFATLLPRQ